MEDAGTWQGMTWTSWQSTASLHVSLHGVATYRRKHCDRQLSHSHNWAGVDVWAGTRRHRSTAPSRLCRLAVTSSVSQRLHQGYFGFMSVQWEEVDTQRPPLFMSTGLQCTWHVMNRKCPHEKGIFIPLQITCDVTWQTNTGKETRTHMHATWLRTDFPWEHDSHDTAKMSYHTWERRVNNKQE